MRGFKGDWIIGATYSWVDSSIDAFRAESAVRKGNPMGDRSLGV